MTTTREFNYSRSVRFEYLNTFIIRCLPKGKQGKIMEPTKVYLKVLSQSQTYYQEYLKMYF